MSGRHRSKKSKSKAPTVQAGGADLGRPGLSSEPEPDARREPEPEERCQVVRPDMEQPELYKVNTR